MKMKITTGGTLRSDMLRGIDKAADAAAAVYGPCGRSVMLSRPAGRPAAAVKGSEIVKEIEPEDVNEAAGVRLLGNMAESMTEQYGDGSTVAILLARSIFRSGVKNIAAGACPVAMRRGASLAARAAVQELRSRSVPAEGKKDIAAAASAAAGSAELGRLAAEALEAVNFRGSVSVRASGTELSYVEHEDGLSFDRGYNSPYMSTDTSKMEAVLENALVFLCSRKIETIDEILPLLNEVSLSGEQLLIVAEDLSERVLTSLLSNLAQKTIKVCAAKAPGYGLAIRDYLEDIAAFTGTVVFGTEAAPELGRAAASDCGRAGYVRVTRDSTLIVGGAGDAGDVAEYVKRLRALLAQAPNELQREKLEQRIASLTDGTAILRIGAVSEVERKSLTEKAAAALSAAKAGFRGGLLPGGGRAYADIAPAVRRACEGLSGDELTGAMAVIGALSEPLRQLAGNAGVEPAEVLSGSAEVADAAEVLIAALEKASALAAQLFTAEAAVLADERPRAPEPVPDNIRTSPGDFM